MGEREREERRGAVGSPTTASRFSPLRAAAVAAAGSPSSLTPLSVASTWNQIYTRRQLVQRSEIYTHKIKAWGMGCTLAALFQPFRARARLAAHFNEGPNARPPKPTDWERGGGRAGLEGISAGISIWREKVTLLAWD